MSATNCNKRYRNYATVVYPESAPANWVELLSDQCVPAFVSPLHNLDVNPDGEIKKAHYHVLLAFDSLKTKDQASDIFGLIGGVGCETVQSLRGYARYLCHLDNPEKHQYLPDDVVAFGGADYHATIGLPTDKYKAIREMMDYIRDNDIYNFADVLEYASENRYDWFRVLCDSSTIVIKEYLKSRSWSADRRGFDMFSRCHTPAGVLVDSVGYVGESVERFEDPL